MRNPTEEGFSLYDRNDFEKLEDDMSFSKEDSDLKGQYMKVLGWDISQYEKAIIEEMKKDFEWYTEDILRNIDNITIHTMNELFESQKNYDPNSIYVKKVFETPQDIVKDIAHSIKQDIERFPDRYLELLNEYVVPFMPEALGGGWNLEDYRFKKYEGNMLISSVTAGDRSCGGSRNFYIPSSMIKDHTYEEFLNAYFDTIASPKSFGLGTEALIHDGRLKAFLGYTELKEHPEVVETDLPDMTVCFKYLYCNGCEMEHIKEDGMYNDKNRVIKGWEIFKKELANVSAYAVKDANGWIPCYWGIMTEDNMFRDDNNFDTCWGNYFRTGTYVTGFEAKSDTPDLDCYKDQWMKKKLPGRHYVVADVTGMNASDYDKTFLNYVNNILPEMGYELSGAILERMDPKNEGIKLYFPVKNMV